MTTVRLWIPDQVRDDERGERTTAPRPKVAIFNLLIRFGHREAATGDVGEWFGRKWDGIAHFRLGARCGRAFDGRSEEHTSELQSLMRISYAVFCLKKKKNTRQLCQSRTQHTDRRKIHPNASKVSQLLQENRS